MHQTFYIDIDEEITSVVERLRHARASEIILVVPKRALLIQSIVNLRILKREADEARLQLMMVTQDKLGKILIEKAGIFVQQKMDNISDEEINLSEEGEEAQPAPEYKTEEGNVKNGKDRLNTIGSSTYFDAKLAEENVKAEQIKLKIEKPVIDRQKTEKEVLVNKELVLVDEKAAERRLALKPSFDLKPASLAIKVPAAKPETPRANNFFDREEKLNLSLNPTPKPSPKPSLNPAINASVDSNFQDKKIEDFFYQPNAIARQTKKGLTNDMDKNKNINQGAYNLPGKVHRWFWAFGIVALFLVAGIGIYVFVPKAIMKVSFELDSQAIDSQVIGKIAISSVDLESGAIPAKAVSSKQEVSESYSASGSALISNQKAHGTVVIYNEYSTSPQSLVATTRFLTSDGKMFRLVKGVTVPGTSMVNGQLKSGEVEAEIAADASGDSFNVGPSTFNIPGFKSSGVKYDKIYAKSAAAMTGGGNGANESKVITDSDIASAKNKILTLLNRKLEEEMLKAGGEDAVILDGGMNESDVAYKLSNATGDVAGSFQVTASAEAKAIVVSQKDLDRVIAEMLSKASDGKKIDAASMTVGFSRADADFANGTLNIKFHAVGKINPEFTPDTIKKAVLGKSEEQIKTYLSGLPNVEKVEVNYWPSFISGRIPLLPSRVSVTLDPK